MLLLQRNAMPTLSDLARRMLRLAGIRIDPVANGAFQTDYIRGITLRSRQGGEEIALAFPESVRIGGISWSHHSNAFVYTVITDEGTQLWLVDLSHSKEPKLLTDRLNTVLDAFDWMPDGKSLLCNLVPENRGAEPQPPPTPAGPNIEESLGNKSPSRNLPGSIGESVRRILVRILWSKSIGADRSAGKDEEDWDTLFIWTTRSIAGWQASTGVCDQKAISYLLPYSGFPRSIEVWDMAGRKLYTVADVPMEENIPIEGVRLGPRSPQWRPGMDASLIWVEALDGGDPRNKFLIAIAS